ncbi:hypothetical protein AGR6A_pAt50078 [Agrobacterium sp. NCPPB 925]|nr:hypothetical protein AGR6A_pAt50078 [Agrobacterium sp. NCPPB 925]
MLPTGSTFQRGAGGSPLSLPPHPQTVGLYITACASGSAFGAAERGAKANSASTIQRRLSSLAWNYAQRGLSLDRKDRHIATVMAGIRNSAAFWRSVGSIETTSCRPTSIRPSLRNKPSLLGGRHHSLKKLLDHGVKTLTKKAGAEHSLASALACTQIWVGLMVSTRMSPSITPLTRPCRPCSTSITV